MNKELIQELRRLASAMEPDDTHEEVDPDSAMLNEAADCLENMQKINAALCASLHAMISLAIPGMNWTDDIGQLILKEAKTNLANGKQPA